jgi:HEAT repeat protein
VWDWLAAGLARIDSFLVTLASAFGTNVRDWPARLGIFCAIYGSIYALSFVPLPWLAVAVLVVGYLGVLAIGRAWVANEKQRTRIVKKLDNTDPDSLPDLRGIALLASLQLLILFPLLFLRINQVGETARPFLAGEPEGFRLQFQLWFLFSFDTLLAWLLGWTRLNTTFPPPEVVPASALGAWLVILKNRTIDFLLIQGVLRIHATWTMVAEGVGALKQDPDLTRRLGRRALLPLLNALTDPDPALRSNAALVLGQLKDPRALPGLIQALSDPDLDVRWQAAEALGQIGDPQAAQALVAALRDPAEAVRRSAVHALVKLPGIDVRASLTELIRGQESGPVRATALEVLAEMGDRDAVPALIDALRDPHEEVRKLAALALGRLRDLRAVEPLLLAASSGEGSTWFQGEVMRALAQLGDPRALPAVLRAREAADPFVRKCAAEALGRLGDSQVVPALIEMLADPAREVRLAALNSLATRRDARALEDLVPVLQDEAEDIREAAADTITAINDRQAVEPLLRVLRAGSNPARQLAAELLGKLRDDRAEEPLLTALTDDVDPETRELAAWALGQLGTARAVEPLRQALQDASRSLRDQAGKALQEIERRSPRSVPADG